MAGSYQHITDSDRSFLGTELIENPDVDAGLFGLADVLADIERRAFNEWVLTEQGKPYSERYDFAWAAWQARARHQRPCCGVKHSRCNYLAACGSICNKCGQSV